MPTSPTQAETIRKLLIEKFGNLCHAGLRIGGGYSGGWIVSQLATPVSLMNPEFKVFLDITFGITLNESPATTEQKKDP